MWMLCEMNRLNSWRLNKSSTPVRHIPLHIIDELRDIDLHCWTPVWDQEIGWRQYTPSSNSTTLESNKSEAIFKKSQKL